MIEKFARFFKLSNFNIWRRNNTNWWPRSWPAQFPTFEASWQRRRRRQQGITEHEVSRAAGRGTTPLMLLLLLRLFRQLGEHPHTKHCNTTKLLRLPGINEFLIWRKQLESLRLTLAMLVFKVSNSKGFDAVSVFQNHLKMRHFAWFSYNVLTCDRQNYVQWFVWYLNHLLLWRAV